MPSDLDELARLLRRSERRQQKMLEQLGQKLGLTPTPSPEDLIAGALDKTDGRTVRERRVARRKAGRS